MMRGLGRKTLWGSGVWMWFEYFHTAWLRLKYIGNVNVCDGGLEMNKVKRHIVADLGEVCTTLS